MKSTLVWASKVGILIELLFLWLLKDRILQDNTTFHVYWPSQYQGEEPSSIYDHSYSCCGPNLQKSIFEIEAQEDEPSPIYWPSQYQEEESSPIYDHSYSCLAPSLQKSIFEIEAQEEEPSLIYDYSYSSPRQQYHEEPPPPKSSTLKEAMSGFLSHSKEYDHQL